jgi:hypothetical protein
MTPVHIGVRAVRGDPVHPCQPPPAKCTSPAGAGTQNATLHQTLLYRDSVAWVTYLLQIKFNCVIFFFLYIFRFFVYTVYLCRPSEASTQYCVIPGGYPPQV